MFDLDHLAQWDEALDQLAPQLPASSSEKYPRRRHPTSPTKTSTDE